MAIPALAWMAIASTIGTLATAGVQAQSNIANQEYQKMMLLMSLMNNSGGDNNMLLMMMLLKPDMFGDMFGGVLGTSPNTGSPTIPGLPTTPVNPLNAMANNPFINPFGLLNPILKPNPVLASVGGSPLALKPAGSSGTIKIKGKEVEYSIPDTNDRSVKYDPYYGNDPDFFYTD